MPGSTRNALPPSWQECLHGFGPDRRDMISLMQLHNLTGHGSPLRDLVALQDAVSYQSALLGRSLTRAELDDMVWLWRCYLEEG